ncbi:MAG: alpha/beta fold hydrolase [Pseudonocardia sp.]|nr:alpha/beta fold hydrolase [Pseudonocardia sp.]MBO0872616.1 alpha/beta fold hydrolase [Pseudonocardia sp.]
MDTRRGRSGAPLRQGSSRRALVLALVAVITLVVGCSHGARPGTGGPGGPPGTANLDRFYGQKLSWGNCARFADSSDDRPIYANLRFDCASLQVPLDYSHPDGDTAQIAVLRQKASDPARRIGSMVVNPGGPGASGTSAAIVVSQEVANSELAQRFDLIGFDPRGVGASQPTIKCYTPAERDADRLDVEVDTSPAGVARIEGKEKDYDAKCAQRSGGDKVLANMGTRDAAKDMDILRTALGDQKLTYLGYSYGTDLGTAYAEDFPNNVRAMVLDGAIDPAQNEVDRQLAQATSFQHAFDAFGAWCAGQQGCPLGTNPAQTTQNYRKLVLPLIEHPVPLDGGRKMSYTDATTGTIQALYSTQLWPKLERGLQELAAGQGTTLMGLADDYYGRQPDGSYAYELDAFTAVNCEDQGHITDPAAALDISKRDLAAAPFEDDGHGPSPARDECAFWPTPNTSSPHVPRAPGLPQVLVISVTGDPATPYQAGVNLAKDLNARLLTVQGTQHTAALQGNTCVDDIVTGYLSDLTLPAEGARCSVAAPH